jgi:hypothetical protein
VLVPATGGGAGHGFVARPRLYLTTIAPVHDDPEAIAAVTDLMLDSVRILPDTPGGPTVPGQIWYGTLQSALETEWGLRAADAQAEEEPASATEASALVSASLSMRTPLVVLSGQDSASESVSSLQSGILDSGALVVVPDGAVEADGWWAIVPGSGETRAMLSPGLRGVRDVLVEPDGRARVFDEIYRKDRAGSKSKARPYRGPGGSHRGLGYNPNDYKQPRKPGLPQGEKFKFPQSRKPPLRPNPPPRCTGQGEYMTVVGCLSLPAAGAFYILGAVYSVSITGIAYGLMVQLDL